MKPTLDEMRFALSQPSPWRDYIAGKLNQVYITDADRLSQSMGQFQLWEGKLFYWSGDRLGWRFLKG